MIGMILFWILLSYMTIHAASQVLFAWFVIATIIFLRIPIAYLASMISETRKFAINLARKHTEFGLAERAIANITGVSVGFLAAIQKTWLFIMWSSLRIFGAYLMLNQNNTISRPGFAMCLASIIIGVGYLRTNLEYVQYGFSLHNTFRTWDPEDTIVPAIEEEAKYLVKTEKDDDAIHHDHGLL